MGEQVDFQTRRAAIDLVLGKKGNQSSHNTTNPPPVNNVSENFTKGQSHEITSILSEVFNKRETSAIQEDIEKEKVREKCVLEAQQGMSIVLDMIKRRSI